MPNSIIREKETANMAPPKFCIANGFAIGELPQHSRDVSLTECKLTSLASVKGHTVIARGGKHKSTKNHFLVFLSHPESIKKTLNSVLVNDEKLLIISKNPMTLARKKVIMRRYEARKSKVNSIFRFYCENNVF